MGVFFVGGGETLHPEPFARSGPILKGVTHQNLLDRKKAVSHLKTQVLLVKEGGQTYI